MPDYVDNRKLLAELIAWQKSRNGHRPKLPIYIAHCCIAIADNLAKLPNFRQYSYLADMRQEALLECMRAAPRFNVAKYDDAFSYFTTVIRSSFKRTIWREKQQRTPGAVAISEFSDRHMAGPSADEEAVSVLDAYKSATPIPFGTPEELSIQTGIHPQGLMDYLERIAKWKGFASVDAMRQAGRKRLLFSGGKRIRPHPTLEQIDEWDATPQTPRRKQS